MKPPEADPIAFRPMEERDIPFGLRLKGFAGWNQTAADWEFFLTARPRGCQVALWGGEPAGTVTTIDYHGALGWIGMLLVDPAFRRRGIGSRLLLAAAESLAGCRTVKLDATPAGEAVYRPLGFEAEEALERRERPAGAPLPGAVGGAEPASEPRPLGAGDLEEVAALDRAAFGADRRPVLAAWLRRAPGYALALRSDGRIRGFLLGRGGSRFEHLGPLIAPDRAAARTLLLAGLRAAGPRPVILDAFSARPGWIDLLEELSFVCQRPFTRMRRGPAAPAGRPEWLWAAAGPEVG